MTSEPRMHDKKLTDRYELICNHLIGWASKDFISNYNQGKNNLHNEESENNNCYWEFFEKRTFAEATTTPFP